MQRPSRSPGSSPRHTPSRRSSPIPPRNGYRRVSRSPLRFEDGCPRVRVTVSCTWLLLSISFIGMCLGASQYFQLSNAQKRKQMNIHNETETVEWINRYNVVHIIETRFMQYQPHLVHLARARLEMFEAVTVPSIISQTNPDFVWVIRTDPDLDQTIRDPLIKILEQVPQAVLVASIENPKGFRNGAGLTDVTEQNVWVGEIDTLHRAHRASQSRIVVSTRLDADDGLERHFVAKVQESAAKDLADEERPYQVFCVANHLEYQHYSVWNKNDEYGAIMGMRTNWCITAGLSWAFTVKAPQDTPQVSRHDDIHKHYRKCSKAKNDEPCLERLYMKSVPGAIRSRTPTSAGMLNLILEGEATTMKNQAVSQLKKSRWKNAQMRIWESLSVGFGIVGNNVHAVRNRMEQNMVNILQDAIRGQCTSGHSCKVQSKLALETLLKDYLSKRS